MTEPTNTPKVMILDDEEPVLNAIRRTLRNEPLEIQTFTSPQAALHELANGKWAVIMADYRMPDMDGIVVMEHAQVLAPDAVRILFSGVADVKTIIAAINQGAVYRVLEKPWDDDLLRIVVRQAVALYKLVLAQRDAEEVARQSERRRVMLESLGAVCHHLGQPATVLQVNLWLLQQQISSVAPELQGLLKECVDAATRLSALLHRLNEINEYRTTVYLANPHTEILDIENHEQPSDHAG